MTATNFGPGLPGHIITDPTTRAGVMVGYEECMINEACHFFVADYATVAVGGTLLFAIATPPAPRHVRLKVSLFSKNVLQSDIYENVTGVSGGTALTPVNSQRDSDSTSNISILTNPAATTLPVKLFGFIHEHRPPIVLKPSTNYAIKIVPIADPPLVVSTEVGYYFGWCE